jgi:putative membrane protein
MKKVFSLILLILTPILVTGCCPSSPVRLWDNGYILNYGFVHGGTYMWLLFLIILGVVVYFIIQATKTKDTAGLVQETPLDILKKRYAKGEINKEDFDRMKKDLE